MLVPEDEAFAPELLLVPTSPELDEFTVPLEEPPDDPPELEVVLASSPVLLGSSSPHA